MTDTTPIDLIPVIVEREEATLPSGFDSWGIKSVHPDLRTSHGFTWPPPGQVAECDPARIDRLGPRRGTGCPHREGDGLCVATSWRGMASSGIPAISMLLVAYDSAEVLDLSHAEGKLLLPRVAVVALVDGQRLLREKGTRADLTRADLRGANLTRADLRGANLQGALGVRQ